MYAHAIARHPYLQYISFGFFFLRFLTLCLFISYRQIGSRVCINYTFTIMYMYVVSLFLTYKNDQVMILFMSVSLVVSKYHHYYSHRAAC
jgi:hypothetical protein